MKYTWGDSVYLKQVNNDGVTVSKEAVSIVWVTPVETEDDSKFFDAPIGRVFYTIEFQDGSMRERVSEDELESYA